MLALKSAPIDSIADFRRALAIAQLPLPLRLLLVWLSLNIGRQCRTSWAARNLRVGCAGRRSSTPFRSGPLVDHRVIDGGLAARAIRALEATLNGPVLDEFALPTQARPSGTVAALSPQHRRAARRC